MFTKTPPAAPAAADPTQLVQALKAKARELLARDHALLDQQLALEGAGVEPLLKPREEPREEALARQILNGYALPAPTGSEPHQLAAIIVERKAIRLALDVLERRDVEARAVAVAQALASGQDEWRRITRSRVEAVLALSAANRRAREFVDQVRKLGSTDPGLVCDFKRAPFGPRVAGDVIDLFLKAAATIDAASEDEIYERA